MVYVWGRLESVKAAAVNIVSAIRLNPHVPQTMHFNYPLTEQVIPIPAGQSIIFFSPTSSHRVCLLRSLHSCAAGTVESASD